jgi:tRNA nucleotidyltransferase (CCA-adding enzyme)
MALMDPSRLLARLRTLPGGERLLGAIGEGGEEVYLVGGAVRDLWLEGAPLDLDLAVVGDVAPLAARLAAETAPAGAQARVGTAHAHSRFGTASVRGPEGVRCDLAATRREAYAAPGALPHVSPAGIDEDLRRRDFTVNALALGLGGPRKGELLSVDRGLDDLGVGRLRILHDASFREDPTRLLRLARYAGRLSFTIEPDTDRLARAAVSGGALSTVSGPRVGAELQLLSAEPDPVAAFAALRGLRIDDAIAPGFGLGLHDAAVARRALSLLPGDGDPVALLLGLATREVGDSQTARRLFDHLGLAAGRRDSGLAVSDADALAARLAGVRRPSQVDAAIGGAPVEAVAAAAGLAGAATLAAQWLSSWRTTTITVTGGDLLAAGIPAGPRIGVGLRAARAARLDGRAADHEAQLAEAIRAATAAS